ncbi:MAG: hypothetical protein KA257_12060 [Opitutaceae bacterium]|nr:hypothetical protein [Opitutaceae bacterium]MBP9913553.1 hypothetical protein [Opitutaceae bacterium]
MTLTNLSTTLSSTEATPAALPTRRLLAAGQPVRIVCFGDSITGIYYHTGGRRAWSDALGATLRRAYPQAPITMINAGISGNTTTDGLRRMETDVLSHVPQLVVVMFGMNDVVRSTPAEFRTNLGQIVQRSQAHGADVVLMTPNWVYPEDASRPQERIAEYAEIVRQTGRELGVPVADALAAFKTIYTTDRRSWTRLMSETIHPNWRGHLVFAAEAAAVITGQKITAPDFPPLQPALPHTLTHLRAGEPLRVVAMKPYDRLIGPALQSIFPQAQVEVTPWDPVGKSVLELEAEAKANGFAKYRDHPELPQPDLFVIAVPAEAAAPDDTQFYRSYTWILNWSQSLDPARGDCLAVLPSVAQPELSPTQRATENFALEVILDKDLPVIRRKTDDTSSPSDLLTAQLKLLFKPAAP